MLSPCWQHTFPTSMTGFLQLLCTTRFDVTPRLCRDGPGLPRQRHGAALAGAANCWRSAVAGHSGSRPNCRKGVPVCAAARGPVSAAAETPSPPDCPRGLLGCQATFRPPVGAATRANSRRALPRPSAPRGGTAVGTGAAALRPCDSFLSPPVPLARGLCGSLPLLDVSGFAAAARPSVFFSPSLQGFAIEGGGLSGVKAWPATALRLAAPGTGRVGGPLTQRQVVLVASAGRWRAGPHPRCYPRHARGLLRSPAGRPPWSGRQRGP